MKLLERRKTTENCGLIVVDPEGVEQLENCAIGREKFYRQSIFQGEVILLAIMAPYHGIRLRGARFAIPYPLGPPQTAGSCIH